MSEREFQRERGWRFPADIDIPEETWYQIPFGDDVTKDQKWEGHVDMAHQRGLDQLETELVDTGVDDDGVRYAVVKASVLLADGTRAASLGSADEVSQQVRAPENTWVVAESRAIKRAVKKALNIMPVEEETVESDPSEPPADAIDVDPDAEEVTVDPTADDAEDW